MSNTVKTPKGTELPLTNLKGKSYLMVAYRLQWFNETETNFSVDTNFLKLENDYAIARAVVSVYDKDGKPVKMASATKREDRKDFTDFMEKAETSAIGRALAMLGYGTQFAISDLEEGNRLADSPLVEVPKATKPVEKKAEPVAATPVADAVTTSTEVKKTTTSFRKPKKVEEVKVDSAPVDGWE